MFKPYQSAVPAFLVALQDAVQTAVTPYNQQNNTNVQVKRGQWVSAESSLDVIVIGWSGFVPGYEYPSRAMSEQLGDVDVNVQVVSEGLAPAMREQIVVNCACFSIKGSPDAPQLVAACASAYASHTLVAQAIAPPRHQVGGTVMIARVMPGHQLHQVENRRGALAIVGFSIEAEAYAQQ